MNGHGSRLVGRRDFLAWESQRGLLLGVATSEAEVHAARDAGELEEFRGGPDTKGARFTVNCQVPVLAANTFTPQRRRGPASIREQAQTGHVHDPTRLTGRAASSL